MKEQNHYQDDTVTTNILPNSQGAAIIEELHEKENPILMTSDDNSLIIKAIYLHHIDQAENYCVEVSLSREQIKKLEATVIATMKHLLDNDTKKKYKITAASISLKSVFEKMSDSPSDHSAPTASARKLIQKEQSRQEEISSLGVIIPKGSLFHMIVTYKSKEYFVINKTDHDKLLGEEDFEIHRGIPIEKKSYKAFYVEIIENSLSEYCYVFDLNNAKYWYEGYLDLNPVYTDTENTKNTLTHFLRILDQIKSKSKEDFNLLKGAIITHYKTNDNIAIERIRDDIFKPYTPVNDTWKKETIINQVNKMCNNPKFDSNFRKDPDAINYRVSKIVKLSEKMKLQLENFDISNDAEKNSIRTFNDSRIGSGIVIITQTGYNHFKDDVENVGITQTCN